MGDVATRLERAPSLAATVYHDLIRINRAVRMRSAPGTLGAGAVSTLWTVVEHAPIRTTELAERENVAAPTMSRIVAALAKLGMIGRSADPKDGRACLISPTEEGADYIHGVASGKAQMFESALGRLDADTRAEVKRTMGLLADALTALDDLPESVERLAPHE